MFKLSINHTDIPLDTRVIIKKEQDKIVAYYEEKKIAEQTLHPCNLFYTRDWYYGILKEDGIEPILYVPLHVHSKYSLLDGMPSTDQIAKYSEYASALTDHGVMSGYNLFDISMRKQGKKPIFGCEVYAENFIDGQRNGRHLVLLAENHKGLKNIIKLTSMAWGNFHNKPHVKWEWLRKYSKGVIVLTACLGGEIPRLLKQNDYDNALKTTHELIDIFGPNNVFIEIQRHGIEDEKIVNAGLERLAKEAGIKIVATTDSHYSRKEDEYAHSVQLCIKTKSKITDERRLKYPGKGYFIHTSAEMYDLFSDHIDWLENTLEIAERCNVEIERGNYKMPTFELPKGYNTQEEYLEYLAWDGFEKRFKDIPEKYLNEEYKERLRFELDVIKRMGFPGYFLIVSDIVVWAKNQEILVGPGRGSAAGSLVAYVLFITDIEPIEYGLLFERFLNPDRITMPDIDLDFQDDRREEVYEYVKQKYGVESVSKIITFGSLAAKVSFRDVARVLKYETDFSNKICKTIPSRQGITLKAALEESPDFEMHYRTDSRVKEVVDIAMQLEGLVRHTSIHACGVIISDRAISDYIPQMRIENDKTKKVEIVTGITDKETESLGLLKVDFLGLRMLGVGAETVRLINQRKDVKTPIEFGTIPIDDVNVYASLAKGHTAGVFQLESAGMTSLMKELFQDIDKLKDLKGAGRECFERLVAGIALYRPGPMDEIPNYLRYMLNPEKIHYEIPQLAKILDNTYSIITYQEQVMQIVRELAGFSRGDADMVRKGMGKKIPELIEEYGQYFIHGSKEKNIPGCVENGIQENLALELWEKMKTFGLYAFNRSHAVSYGDLSAKTAWLAHYFPVEYMTAILNSYINKAERIRLYTSVCIQKNIPILPPHINLSEEKFSVDGNGIRFGLRGIRNVGSFSAELIDVRNKIGRFINLQDTVLKMTRYSSISKRNLEAMIYSGGLDCFNGTRRGKINIMQTLLDSSKFEQEYSKTGRESFISYILNQTDPTMNQLKELFKVETPDIEEFDKNQKLEKEYEFAGFYITEHPIDQYAHMLINEIVDPISLLTEEPEEEAFEYDVDTTTNIYQFNRTPEMKSTTGAFNENYSAELDFSDEASLINFEAKRINPGDFVQVAGVIRNLEIKLTKKDHSRMAIFDLQDRTGTIKVVLFNKEYERAMDNIRDGRVVKIKGTFENGDFGPQVIGKTVIDLQKNIQGNELKRIELVSAGDVEYARQQYRRTQQIANDFEGDIEIIFHNTNNGISYKMPCQIRQTAQSIQQLKYLFGENQIKFTT